MDYEYPLETDWSIDEIIKVMNLYQAIEQAYEEGINKDELLDAYREFKTVVDSIAYEKQIDKAFKEVSSYSIYQTIKKTKENLNFIKM